MTIAEYKELYNKDNKHKQAHIENMVLCVHKTQLDKDKDRVVKPFHVDAMDGKGNPPEGWERLTDTTPPSAARLAKDGEAQMQAAAQAKAEAEAAQKAAEKAKADAEIQIAEMKAAAQAEIEAAKSTQQEAAKSAPNEKKGK